MADPVINIIEYMPTVQKELDKAAKEKATSGWMEPNERFIRYQEGKEVKIPKMDMDGLGNYDPDEGFVDGAINLDWQTKQMTQDRGRRFTFDEQVAPDSHFILTAASVMGEFQRTKVIPEIDAYRYSRIAAIADQFERCVFGYAPNESTLLKNLYADIAAVQETIGDDTTPLVITMARTVAAMLDLSPQISKSMSVTDFKQGDLTLKVQSLNGEHPIIRVGSARLKTEYIFNDGKTDGQKKGGFVPAATAKDINWIICPRTTPIAVSRTDKIRVFDPETYQPKRAWAMDYRRYHDLWMLENQMQGVLVNVRQPKV